MCISVGTHSYVETYLIHGLYDTFDQWKQEKVLAVAVVLVKDRPLCYLLYDSIYLTIYSFIY